LINATTGGTIVAIARAMINSLFVARRRCVGFRRIAWILSQGVRKKASYLERSGCKRSRVTRQRPQTLRWCSRLHSAELGSGRSPGPATPFV